MESNINSYPKTVVVHAGKRDNYQLALAMHEAGLLQSLVTDMYFPADKSWFASTFGRCLPANLISKRFCPQIGSAPVRVSTVALAASALMSLQHQFRLDRFKDKALSRKARVVARMHEAAVFSTTYYGYEAFKEGVDRPKYRFLFQLQADPRTVRRLLLEEIERTPFASASLKSEYELSLSEEELRKISMEPHLANGWVAPSHFAAETLAEHGIPSDRIHIVPFGVTSEVFGRRAHPPDSSKPFKIIFVGQLIQRKGISYLLDAMRMLNSSSIQLVLCTRGRVDETLLARYSDLNIEIKHDLSGKQLAAQLHNSDVFILPSISEGLALVLLETMSCGVPLIATHNTGASTVMEDGVDGFVVPIRSAEAIAERIEWGVSHRTELATMGDAAAVKARTFTWERFRAGIVEAYKEMVAVAVT